MNKRRRFRYSSAILLLTLCITIASCQDDFPIQADVRKPTPLVRPAYPGAGIQIALDTGFTQTLVMACINSDTIYNKTITTLLSGNADFFMVSGIHHGKAIQFILDGREAEPIQIDSSYSFAYCSYDSLNKTLVFRYSNVMEQRW